MKQLPSGIIVYILILFFITACSDDNKTVSYDNTEVTEFNNAPPVITVNGKAMEQAELDKHINKIINSTKGRIPAEEIDKLKTKISGLIINNFISSTLVKEECNKLKIEVTKKEIDDKLNEYMKRLPKDMDLDATLKQAGMEMKELNDNISFELKLEKLVALKTKDQLAPTEAEIKEFIQTKSKQQFSRFNTSASLHARHILIKTDSKDTKEVKKEKNTELQH